MKKVILAAAIAAGAMVLLPGQAFAQDGSAMMAALFPDPNGDGVTSKEEMLQGSAARFDQLDTDKDGKLSQAEQSAGPGGRMLARADADGDGFVTRDEMAAAAGMRFDRIDANHDGKIDATEKEAVRQRMMQMRQGN
ncbi:EF-hand domain-containing protein [Sphingomonas sp. LB-2]|uniref:EF-hand domain-containing protein n=1 Tax=Sphingomonas caeni TaxID=2984949 RepID=UPI002230E7A7|nr:EF-hand domain-containing protein [Sphingomonas caeni]MCW3846957.1 EF-hand domain-containing protein [Sphingomonas caeni]